MKLDLDLVRKRFAIDFRRVAMFVGLTENLRDNDAVAKYLLPPRDGISACYLPEDLSATAVRDGRHALADWVLMQGLRDLVEALEVVLIGPFRIGLAALLHNNIVDAARADELLGKFSRNGLIPKSTLVKGTLGIELPYRAELHSLNVLRNCMSHRRGVVGREDCDHGEDHMTVRWMALEPVFILADGSVHPARMGEVCPENAAFGVQAVSRRREFSVGHRVQISIHELAELLLVFHLAADEFLRRALARLSELGIKIEERSASREKRVDTQSPPEQ